MLVVFVHSTLKYVPFTQEVLEFKLSEFLQNFQIKHLSTKPAAVLAFRT